MPYDAPENGPNHQTTRTTDPRGELEPRRLRVPGLVILAHPDPRRVGEEVALHGLASEESVGLSRLEPMFAATGQERRRPLDVAHLSRRPLLLVPGPEPGSVVLERAESGTRVTVGGEEIETRRAFSAAEVERGVVLVLSRRVAVFLHPVEPFPTDGPRFDLVGDSAAIRQLCQEILSAADLDVPVLLRGETGTGKELVARALHEAGPRRRGPWVAVNMAALPPTLAAAELFGAVRGAYTGADRQKPGFFRGAEGGTLFLDEIGEAPVEVQALLLRTLETREIRPVGSVETHSVDVRVIAATDADLEAAIAEDRFRAPLLHRLAGYEILLPTLRERRDDVARLLVAFLDQESRTLPPEPADRPWPPAELMARLVAYDWR